MGSQIKISIEARDLHQFTSLLEVLVHETEQAAGQAQEGTDNARRLRQRADMLDRLLTRLEVPLVRTLVRGAKVRR